MTTQWMDGAACAKVDPEIFFPNPGDNPSRAKKICAGCPVRNECLAYALSGHIRTADGEPATIYGVWGGLTYAERELKLRQLRRARPGSGQVRSGAADRL